MRVPQIFNHRKQTMRRMLFGYMLVLVLVVFVLIFTFFLLFGNYTTAKESLADTLSLQMEVLEREITSHHDNLAMRGVKLSEDVSGILQYYFYKNHISFENLQNSRTHLNALQSEFIELLTDEIMQAECSGAFIILDTTVNASVKDSATSKSGVYLQRSSVAATDDTLVLFRGDSTTGKNHGIMPHRKWKLELDSGVFPDYQRIMDTKPDVPLEKTYSTTDVIALPETSEKIMLITLPIRGYDGTVFGICGFEISATTFKAYHSQPSTFKHLMCLFSKTDDTRINFSKSFTSGISGGYHYAPQGIFKTKDFGKGLSSFVNENEEYVGIIRNTNIHCDSTSNHTLCVMIPKHDYTNMFVENALRQIILIILLMFFAISCCGYFSKRYISPIVKKLEVLKSSDLQEEFDSSYSEIDDLFVFLRGKEDELLDAKSKVDRLSYSRKNEIIPDDYEYFRTGLKSLTKSERNIFDLYLKGKTAKEIIEIANIKERTLKFHNSNLYSKLGVKNLKELLRFAAIYDKEENQ